MGLRSRYPLDKIEQIEETAQIMENQLNFRRYGT